MYYLIYVSSKQTEIIVLIFGVDKKVSAGMFMLSLSKLHMDTAVCGAGIQILTLIEGQHIHVKHYFDIKLEAFLQYGQICANKFALSEVCDLEVIIRNAIKMHNYI